MNITEFESGVIYFNGEKVSITNDVSWDKHPTFANVYTKKIFSGKLCNNNLSAMIVKIEPNYMIGNHIHEGKAELHEIISGDGTGVIGSNNISYKPGVISLIPGDTAHSVIAGESGLILLAKFMPALF